MSFSPIKREMLETWLLDKKGTFLSLPFSPAKAEEIFFVYYAWLHVYVSLLIDGHIVEASHA